MLAAMAINPATTTRKLLTLSHDLVDRIASFQQAKGIRSEAEAVRQLIERGLVSTETAVELYDRVAKAVEAGWSVSRIVSDVVGEHPLMVGVSITVLDATISLSNGQAIIIDRTGKHKTPVVLLGTRGEEMDEDDLPSRIRMHPSATNRPLDAPVRPQATKSHAPPKPRRPK